MPEFYGRVVTCEPVGRFLRMSTIKWKDGHGVAEIFKSLLVSGL